MRILQRSAAWALCKPLVPKSIPFVYELRAFWEDAAVDQNKTSSRSLRYRLSQKLEDYVVHRAGAVVGISQSILDEYKKQKSKIPQDCFIPEWSRCREIFSGFRDEGLAAKTRARQ